MRASLDNSTGKQLLLLPIQALCWAAIGPCCAPQRDDTTLVLLVSGLPPAVAEIRVQLVQDSRTAERMLPIIGSRAELDGVRKLPTHVVATAGEGSSRVTVELELDLTQAAERVEQTVVFLGSGAWTELAAAGQQPVARAWPYCAYDGQGSVLVFGGIGGVGSDSSRLNDVWSFDIENRTWQLLWEHTTEPTGAYPVPRYGGAAIFSDGKLYAFSGVHAFSGDDRFEIWTFDPLTQEWHEVSYSSTGPVVSSAFLGATYDATLNSVWFYGGEATTYSYTLSPFFYRFDLLSNTMTQQTFLTTDDHHYIVDELAMAIGGPSDARVLVAFGGTEGNALGTPNRNPRAETWQFDFALQDWNLLSFGDTSTPSARSDLTFTSLTQNEAFLFGGANLSYAFNDSWVYSVAEQSWRQVIPLGQASPVARSGHCAVAISQGTEVLIFGGNTSGSLYADLNDVWVFVVP